MAIYEFKVLILYNNPGFKPEEDYFYED